MSARGATHARALGALLSAALAFARDGAAAPPDPPAARPTPAEAADAKRRFDAGLRLYRESAFEPALAEFEASYRLGGRPSALRNAAQCHRDLKRFAAAYEAYEALVTRHAGDLKADETAAIRRALDELALLTGTVELGIAEPRASVELDGKDLGAPPPVLRVSVGSHKLRVQKQGFEPFDKEIAVSSGQALTLEVRLVPEITTGRLAVRERDGDPVRVLVDGEDVGAAPWEGDLAPGEHRVALGGERFRAEPQLVRIERRGRVDLVIDAVSTMGRLRVTTLPASAKIVLDGRELGTGAWEGELSPGKHEVEVRAPGYAEVRRTVTLARGEALVQEIAVPGYTSEAEPDYEGFYARLDALLSVGLHQAAPNVPEGRGSSELSTPLGFGATVRVGYSFGILAAEVAGTFVASQHRDEQIQIEAVGGEEVSVFSFGGFVGAGGRISSPAPTVRFTFGADLGIAIRNLMVRTRYGYQVPCDQGKSCDFEQSLGYVAPALVLDGGVLFGSTPGAKLFLGVAAWLEIPPDPDLAAGPDLNSARSDDAFASPGRGILVASDVAFFVGPALGVQFGH